MKGIIFDMDGVLVDSMPMHYQAWKAAFKEVADIDVTEREIYLLEGMRGIDLVNAIFQLKRIGNNTLAQKVNDKKNQIFRSVRSSRPFEGVAEIISNTKCLKAVVSGSARQDVKTILDESFEKNAFDAIVTGDDVKKGKPDPTSFNSALNMLGILSSDAIVVENAPLGVKAANNAKIDCVVVLNTSPLNELDFINYIAKEKIFKETQLIKPLLQRYFE